MSEFVSELSAQRPCRSVDRAQRGAVGAAPARNVDRAQRGRAVNAQLLLVAHGTRDPAGAAVTEAVAAQVRGLLGGAGRGVLRRRPAAHARRGARGAAGRGGRGADVPRGGLPRARRRARPARRHGPRRRAAGRDVRPRPRARRRRGVPAARPPGLRDGDAVVLAADRLQRPATRRPTGPRPRVGWRGSCASPVTLATIAMGGPRVPDAVARLRADGARRVAVASWLLAPGLFQRALVASRRRRGGRAAGHARSRGRAGGGALHGGAGRPTSVA